MHLLNLSVVAVALAGSADAQLLQRVGDLCRQRSLGMHALDARHAVLAESNDEPLQPKVRDLRPRRWGLQDHGARLRLRAVLDNTSVHDLARAPRLR